MTAPPGAFSRSTGIVAVLETSVLVRAFLSPAAAPNASRRLMLLAGTAFDSFTSPSILEEVEEVLAWPRFAADPAQVRRWLDAFIRSSLQVFPDLVQVSAFSNARVVRGDADDLPILHTAFAAAAAADHTDTLAAARSSGGWFLVSENTRHFTPGWNVYGWQFVTSTTLLQQLLRRRSRDQSTTGGR